MFALFAFGSLFGFIGLLVAVPASAAVAVVIRFALGRYLASEIYLGHARAAADTAQSSVSRRSRKDKR